jgi:hypothetical protein
MLGLVLANNFLQIYIFWELVGLCSYLLIGFYFKKQSAADAAKKAFVVTRFGDLGFLLGILFITFYVDPDKLGMSSAEVTKLAGQPDQVKGSKAFYGTRDITLEYDAVGKLFRITAESGATARGATICDSEQMVQALYGAPAQQSGNWLIYSDGTRNLKFQMVNVQGTNYVKAFVLERRQ